MDILAYDYPELNNLRTGAPDALSVVCVPVGGHPVDADLPASSLLADRNLFAWTTVLRVGAVRFGAAELAQAMDAGGGGHALRGLWIGCSRAKRQEAGDGGRCCRQGLFSTVASYSWMRRRGPVGFVTL